MEEVNKTKDEKIKIIIVFDDTRVYEISVREQEIPDLFKGDVCSILRINNNEIENASVIFSIEDGSKVEWEKPEKLED